MTNDDLCVCGPMTRAQNRCDCGAEEAASELLHGGIRVALYGNPGDSLERPYFVSESPFEYDDLLAVYAAARGFIATTSFFRQNKASRDSFEALALAVLKLRMVEAGRSMGEVEVA